MRIPRLLRAPLSFVVVTVLATSTVAAGSPPPPDLTTLDPGARIDLHQTLPVNIVFLGYEAGASDDEVDAAAFEDALPSGYNAISRFPAFYGLNRPAHVSYDYDYNLVWADEDFEDDFFGYLGSIADPAPLTVMQSDYNDQENKNPAVTVADSQAIDAPSVEQWLAAHAMAGAGVDPTEYTVFFVNWWGRADFEFHVYTKTDEPDPDTGYNFGVIRDSRKMIAWGGTASDDPQGGPAADSRVWFHDLSAGPESWTDNWNVDDADVDGDDVLDYRMPPIWEYGNTDGYRPFDDLTGDLAKLTQYVALDLLFTTSPLYKPALSAPALPTSIQVDITAWDGDPAVSGASFIDTGYITDKLSALMPEREVSTELSSRALIGRAFDVYRCFIEGHSCFGSKLFRIAFADLFLYFRDKVNQFLEGDADYEVGVWAFNSPNELDAGGLLGFADDNWTDGTQSFVFAFDDPLIRELGFGFTDTITHEVGHHVGMSHPHDGYDSTTGIDFGPSGDFYYAWSGDESNTVMNYLAVNGDFSQFDRDNLNRVMAAAYLNQANAVLARVYASARAGRATALLLAADADAAAAVAAFQASDWEGALFSAKAAYDTVMDAAASINVQIEPHNFTADLKSHGQSYANVDPVTDHRSRP